MVASISALHFVKDGNNSFTGHENAFSALQNPVLALILIYTFIRKYIFYKRLSLLNINHTIQED
jgi:hypothetical protein